MITNVDTGPTAKQLDENDRLMRELVELWDLHITSTTDSLRVYDVLHEAGRLCQRDSFYKWLLGLLRPRAGQRLLDISCGQGTLLQFAAQRGLQVSGLDISPQAAAMAARRSSADISIANAEWLPYADHTFDYATNVGSLEHYFHPYLALREIARVLRPDGLALILLPNTFGLLGNILHAWRKGDVHNDGQPLQRYGTNVQWRKLLELNCLHVVRVVKYEREWPRTWSDLLWYALHPYKLGRVFLSPLIPQNLSSFLVYLCRRAC